MSSRFAGLHPVSARINSLKQLDGGANCSEQPRLEPGSGQRAPSPGWYLAPPNCGHKTCFQGGVCSLCVVKYSTEISMAGLNQIQINFNPEQDRLLLRLSTSADEEYRIWLTRRYTGLLWQALTQALSQTENADPDISTQPDEEHKQAVKKFKQESALSKADFSTPFKKDETRDYPIGESGILAHGLNYKVNDRQLMLDIKPKQGQGMQFTVNPDLNVSLRKLLMDACNQAGWNLPFQTKTATPSMAASNSDEANTPTLN